LHSAAAESASGRKTLMLKGLGYILWGNRTGCETPSEAHPATGLFPVGTNRQREPTCYVRAAGRPRSADDAGLKARPYNAPAEPELNRPAGTREALPGTKTLF
jgi:hypothetical protein